MRTIAIAALTALFISTVTITAPSVADPAAPETSQTYDLRASRTEPDPSLEPIRAAGDNGPGGSVSRTAYRGCASNYRWLGLCALAGYALTRSCDRAWCGLLGAMTIKGRAVYRADMMSGDRPRGYRPVAIMRASKGRKNHCNWTTRRAHVAGYLLSRYGQTGANNRAAAAVDLAVAHVLCGHRWRINSKATRKRLRGAYRPAQIKRRAHRLVAAASAQAGPYRMRVSATEAVVDTPLTITAVIKTEAGRPAFNRRVRLRMPDGTSTDAYTNGHGEASWTFTMPAGTIQAKVIAPALESPRLHVRQPRRRSAARVFLSGRTYAVVRTVTVTTKQKPRLAITASNGKIPGTLPASMTYSESLGAESKTVTVQLRGPFASSATASCGSGSLATSQTFTVTANGTYALPKPGSTAAPKKGGFYRWRVVVAEDSQNTAAAACSNPVELRRATPRIPAATMQPEAGEQYRVGRDINPAGFEYLEGYGTSSRAVTSRLWGPFDTKAQASCAAGDPKIARAAEWSIAKASGWFHLIRPDRTVSVNDPGWYRFEVRVGADTANDPTSVCGPRFKVIN